MRVKRLLMSLKWIFICISLHLYISLFLGVRLIYAMFVYTINMKEIALLFIFMGPVAISAQSKAS